MKNLLWSLLLIFIFSCSPDRTNNAEIVSKGDYQNGFFMLNSGTSTSQGNLHFIASDFTSTTPYAYFKVNHDSLGLGAHSGKTYGDHLYLIISGAQKILKVNRNTLEKENSLEMPGTTPLFMTVHKGVGYLTTTDGTNGNLRVINLTDLSTIKNIPLPSIPGKIFSFQDNIYVLLSGAATQQGSRLAVIDPTSNTLIRQLQVGYNPNSFTGYKDKILIACGGHQTQGVNDENASIWALDASGNVSKVFSASTTASGDFTKITDINYLSGRLAFLSNNTLVIAEDDFTNLQPVNEVSYQHLFSIQQYFVATSSQKITAFNNTEKVWESNTSYQPVAIIR